VAKGRDTLEPVRHITSPSLIRVDARETCFETMLKMIKYNIHHMLVIKEGQFKGILTNHDLMLLQGTSPLSLVHDILNQQSIEGLIPLSRKINQIVGLLLKEEAKASSISRIITRNQRSVDRCGSSKSGNGNSALPPSLTAGWSSAARAARSRPSKPTRTTGWVYVDPTTPEQEAECGRYFSRLATAVSESLIQVGFPPCPAQYMASNPEWCQPLKVWKKIFHPLGGRTRSGFVVEIPDFF